MISMQNAVMVIVYLVVGGMIFGLLTMLVQRAPFIPEGWKSVILWILLALAILVMISVLLNFVGGVPVFRA
jgi:hypothetical protein